MVLKVHLIADYIAPQIFDLTSIFSQMRACALTGAKIKI